jgi:hypothetical protein
MWKFCFGGTADAAAALPSTAITVGGVGGDKPHASADSGDASALGSVPPWFMCVCVSVLCVCAPFPGPCALHSLIHLHGTQQMLKAAWKPLRPEAAEFYPDQVSRHLPHFFFVCSGYSFAHLSKKDPYVTLLCSLSLSCADLAVRWTGDISLWRWKGNWQFENNTSQGPLRSEALFVVHFIQTYVPHIHTCVPHTHVCVSSHTHVFPVLWGHYEVRLCSLFISHIHMFHTYIHVFHTHTCVSCSVVPLRSEAWSLFVARCALHTYIHVFHTYMCCKYMCSRHTCVVNTCVPDIHVFLFCAVMDRQVQRQRHPKFIHIFVYTYMCVYMYTHICVNVYMHVRAHTMHVCVFMCACMYTHIYVCVCTSAQSTWNLACT